MKKLRLCCMVIAILACITIISVLGNPDCLIAGQASGNIRMQNPAETGSGLYEKYCAMCHGADGIGYIADEANAISNQDFLKSASDEYIIQGILRGRPDTAMSAWGKDKGGILTQADAEAILAFIRTWQKEPPADLNNAAAKGDAQNGEELFQRWCAACHGKYGVGGKAVKLNNPVFLDTASDGFIRYAIENGRRNTQMTAYKNILNAGEIEDVISYIRTLNTNDSFRETVAADNEELSKVIKEKGVINPENPPAEFTLIDNRFVPADDVYNACKAGQSLIIVDARPASDYLRSHVKGAISIPFYDMENAVGLLPKDIWIITYCACPHILSGKAADILIAADYKKVAILNEGLFYWIEKGYPSESNINSQLPTD